MVGGRYKNNNKKVGVEMIISDHPLHRSGRAALPHPAPTSGDDAQAHEWIRVADTSGRKPGIEQRPHAGPRQVIALAAPTQHSPPYPTDRTTEGTDRRAIHRHAVVTHVSENNRAQVLANRWDGVVHARFKFGLHRLKLRLPPFAHGLAQHREATLASLPAAVREAQEVKAPRRAPITAILPIAPRTAPELDQSRLLGVQFQSKARKPFAQLGEEPLGLDLMLEPNDKVIGKAHHDDITAGLLLPPSLDPQVEHIMQVNIGQQRANASTLNRTDLTLYSLAILKHTSTEPFLDQPHDALIRHTMLNELHEPRMLQRIEEATQIRIEHPVHFPRRDPDRQRIQRLVRITFRSEAVREAEEVLLVDCIQHLDNGALDDFILQHRHPQRALPTAFRYEHSTHRSCSVRAPLEPRRQILKVALQVLSIVLPGLAIYSRSSVSLDRKICRPQSLDVVYMVQKRGELLLLILLRYLTYPLERAVHTVPALCPECVAFERVPLGPAPSLHRLRSHSFGFVRRLHRYYGSVRLPISVHRRLRSFDCPTRSADLAITEADGISRFPSKVHPYMRGVFDRAGFRDVLPWRRLGYCLPPLSRTSAPRSNPPRGGALISQLNTQPARSPVNASPATLRTPMHDSGPMWLARPSMYKTFIYNTLPV